MEPSISEQLIYSTVRIECEYVDGSKGTGTGFFYKFFDTDTSSVPVIITNKHVIKDASYGKLVFTTITDDDELLDNHHFIIRMAGFEAAWFNHPDIDVDLCAMPLIHCWNEAKKVNKTLFYAPLGKQLIPNQEDLNNMFALEEILMIGYPNGIWDSVNNKPLLRRGITATHPKFDYNGKKEIMIDAACFPGSSGSPVFLFNEHSYFDRKTGRLIAGTRMILLGVLYAGPQHTAQGDIEIINIPTGQKPVAISRIPNNLGLVIKSERILELEKHFEHFINVIIPQQLPKI